MKEDQMLDPMFELSPESKLELVGGQLFVGNGLAGSRLLLHQILRGWGAVAATALGTTEQWIEALCAAYDLKPAAFAEQATARDYQVPDLSAGDEGPRVGHRQTGGHLRLAFHRAADELGGRTLGRDFVMKLGEDGLTPDLLFCKCRTLNTLHEYHLDGPAELVIEIVRPTHAVYDCEVKRELYARGGVPAYLLVHPDTREVEFFSLINGDYRLAAPDSDGRYRPPSVPGLAVDIDALWVEKGEWHSDKQPFIVEQTSAAAPGLYDYDDGIGWGDLPFAPRLALTPVGIRFDEYGAWGPEAKFEWMDGKPSIGGRHGIRNLTGMLAMTFGLTEVCRLAPPREWAAAIENRREREARDRQIKDEWWRKAHTVAALLRDKYGVRQVGVTGDLPADGPLGFWSELTLVSCDLPAHPPDRYEIWRDVSAYEDEVTPEINVCAAEETHFKRRAEVSGWKTVEI